MRHLRNSPFRYYKTVSKPRTVNCTRLVDFVNKPRSRNRRPITDFLILDYKYRSRIMPLIESIYDVPDIRMLTHRKYRKSLKYLF